MLNLNFHCIRLIVYIVELEHSKLTQIFSGSIWKFEHHNWIPISSLYDFWAARKTMWPYYLDLSTLYQALIKLTNRRLLGVLWFLWSCWNNWHTSCWPRRPRWPLWTRWCLLSCSCQGQRRIKEMIRPVVIKKNK